MQLITLNVYNVLSVTPKCYVGSWAKSIENDPRYVPWYYDVVTNRKYQNALWTVVYTTIDYITKSTHKVHPQHIKTLCWFLIMTEDCKMIHTYVYTRYRVATNWCIHVHRELRYTQHIDKP